MKKLLQELLCAVLTFAVSFGLVKIISRPYEKQKVQETVLRQNLYGLRKAIDQYALDQEQLPQSLNDLVRQGYIREIPSDPITSHRDWQIEFGKFKGMYGSDGIVDIHSSSSNLSVLGIPYSEF